MFIKFSPLDLFLKFYVRLHVFPNANGKAPTYDVPKEWSLANICPLFKKGDRSFACNYRPVSLTFILCKILEQKKVQVGKDQEKAQSEKDSHSNDQGGKKQN